MIIGLYFSANKNNGGVFQYSLSFLEAIKNIKEHNFVIFNDSSESLEYFSDNFKIVNLNSAGTKNTKLKKNIFRLGYRIILSLRFNFIIDKFGKFATKSIINKIKEENISIMIFLGQSFSAHFLNMPTVNIVYDLQHRINPRFPEVSKRGIWQMREYFYKKITKKSSIIIVDSEVGKNDLIKFYNFPSKKIIVLPFLAPDYLENNITNEAAKKLIAPLALPDKFIFYPAQFWPHKNHINILKAIKNLKDSNLKVNVVFCGSTKDEWGEYQKLKEYINNNNLQEQVFYLGYVDNSMMSSLYRLAVALIMPTFFGPTNIPVLEAWKMECPVIYSNIAGCKEQLGNAGLLIDPNNFTDIADKIETLWTNELLRVDLIKKGSERLGLWTYNDFATTIRNMINNLANETYGTKNN